MILTVTPNSALDRVFFLDEFKPGTTMRPHKMIESVGGKGFNTSVVLQTLNADNVALGFVAGATGRRLVSLLDGYGIQHDLTWVEGETRLSQVLVETAHYRHSHIIAAGLTVSELAYQAFLALYQNHLSQATWVVTSGTLPSGVPLDNYHRLVEMAHAAHVPILIDSSNAPILKVLPARPAIVKMNRDEFFETFKLQPSNFDNLITTAKQIRQQEQLPALVITCGADGIVACTAEATYLASTPPQQAVNAAGAGDGVSAALAWRLVQGDTWPKALHWAAAVGAAVVLTEGTADCTWADIERLWEKTQVQVV